MALRNHRDHNKYNRGGPIGNNAAEEDEGGNNQIQEQSPNDIAVVD